MTNSRYEDMLRGLQTRPRPYGVHLGERRRRVLNAVAPSLRQRLTPSVQADLADALLMLEDAGYEVMVRPKAPTWQIGDVVVMRFPGNPRPYTYVHDGKKFPGFSVDRSNEEMADAWRAGTATLIARAGKHFHDVGPYRA